MKKEFKVILIILLVIIALVIGYFIGYKRAYEKIENASENVNYIDEQQTFYAEIKEINNNNAFLVEGLSVNDINYRGDFTFSVVEETKLEWRGTEISISDLKVGDNISITFDGEILDTYPAQIKEVIKIQLLDDEN